MNPRWLKTEDDDSSDICSWYNMRLPPRLGNNAVREVLQGKELGAGAFGKVDKAIDLDSGHLMAVKFVELKTDKDKASLHREIKEHANTRTCKSSPSA